MPGGNANKFFDTSAFWCDVLAWKKRWRYTWRTVSDLIEVDRDTVPESLYNFTCNGVAPSLHIVTGLAGVADLDLNKYVRSPL